MDNTTTTPETGSTSHNVQLAIKASAALVLVGAAVYGKIRRRKTTTTPEA